MLEALFLEHKSELKTEMNEKISSKIASFEILIVYDIRERSESIVPA